MLNNTELGVVLGQREDETWQEYTDRIAVQTLFAARDRLLRFEDQAIAVADVMRKVHDAR